MLLFPLLIFFVWFSGNYASAATLRQTPLWSVTQWLQGYQAPSNYTIHLSISLALQNCDAGVESLLSLSDPASSKYGQHWTGRKVAQTFRPAPETTWEVLDWLNSSGISSTEIVRSRDGGHLHLNLTAGRASRLLETNFYRFTSRKTGEQEIGCYFYYIPSSLSEYVDHITFRALAPSRHRRRRTPSTSGTDSHIKAIAVNCSEYTTPACLRELYNIPIPATAHPSNSFGIYEPAYVTWLPEDLDQFFTYFQPNLTGQRPAVEAVDGGYLQTQYRILPFNLEPDLDFEYAMTLTAPQTVTNIQVGDQYILGDVNDMLAAFDKYYCYDLDPYIDPLFPDKQPGGYNKTTECGAISFPNVLSVSFADSEASYPAEYLHRQCFEFLKLGLMGVTVLFSSGDSGISSGSEPGACFNTTTGADNATTGNFSPNWPAACPWVTAVGATQLLPQLQGNSGLVGAKGTNETALDAILAGNRTVSSGGGFSNVFQAPAYQRMAITAYQQHEQAHLSHLLNRFNRTGRGYPDVSAQGYAYLTVVEGQVHAVYGTSAATPVFASIVTLINNERLQMGKRPVGFVNPALYANPEVMNDVVSGANKGCGVDPAFQATVGWDPVTGLGSPDYRRMRDLFVRLP